MRADLTDLSADEFVVPDRATHLAIGTAGRAARHSQREDAARRKRHLRFIGVSEAYDLARPDEAGRLEHLGGAHQIAVAALILRPPAGRLPFQAKARDFLG